MAVRTVASVHTLSTTPPAIRTCSGSTPLPPIPNTGLSSARLQPGLLLIRASRRAFQQSSAAISICFSTMMGVRTSYIRAVGIVSGGYVQMLDTSFRNGTGPASYLGDTDDEAPTLFKRGSTYYVIYGRTCPFCGGTDTYYRAASSPLGTWSAETSLSSGTCGGQPTMVSPLSINGSTTYIFQADLWRSSTADRQRGWPNQGLATQFWLPLGFNGTAINPITCDATFTAELTASPPAPEPGVDQTTEGSPFGTHCGINDIGSDYARLQTFTASPVRNPADGSFHDRAR